jgi:hypothetical protein
MNIYDDIPYDEYGFDDYNMIIIPYDHSVWQ